MLLAMFDPDELSEVRGTLLRSLLTLVLDAERPLVMSLPELAAGVAASGFRVAGRSSKNISDALRWEVGRGRVVRVGRGRYAAGRVAKTTRRRMRGRIANQRRLIAAAEALSIRPDADIRGSWPPAARAPGVAPSEPRGAPTLVANRAPTATATGAGDGAGADDRCR